MVDILTLYYELLHCKSGGFSYNWSYGDENKYYQWASSENRNWNWWSGNKWKFATNTEGNFVSRSIFVLEVILVGLKIKWYS